MGHYKYDRLSAQDNDFLQWESEILPMHGAAVQIFDVGPLSNDDGGIDFRAIKDGIEGILHKIPRYRQKIAWLPDSNHAIWVDDPHFNIDYHVRHTALPRPGDDAQLKALTSRITERALDRSRPLWELWVVEGLTGNRFAIIGKTHHCVMDGEGGTNLLQSLYSAEPIRTTHEPHRYIPRPQPSNVELRRDEWLRLASLPLRAVAELQRFIRSADDLPGEVLERLRALGGLAMWKVVPASDTPLNGPVGPHRIIDWLAISLDDVKAIRKVFDCSVNDVVLGIVTGAIRDFLIARQTDPRELDFRIATPVNVRPEQRQGTAAGNFVSTWILPLPIGEPDPRKQIEAIHATTKDRKKSRQESAIELIEAIHEWIPIDLQGLSSGTQNVYVSNIRGPQLPLYLLGAQLKELYLQAPLIQNLGLAIAVMSYDGKVCWGFNADYDRLPDVADLTALVQKSFERLAEAAGVHLEGTPALELPSAHSSVVEERGVGAAS
ncbi:MAG: wax ester/triacylglycerol synthase family O-acyltransferase [Deltaproteobacteria bacterium]|nr:wax ester/triacylglycerol synthase family O-acyltransferase [Deltaproteobacteria bacterium]